jgi:hypothetical protein
MRDDWNRRGRSAQPHYPAQAIESDFSVLGKFAGLATHCRNYGNANLVEVVEGKIKGEALAC